MRIRSTRWEFVMKFSNDTKDGLQMTSHFIRWFNEIGLADVGLVGGKNASLGEMYRELTPRGIRVPNGFAITADGYRHFLKVENLDQRIASMLKGLNTSCLADLALRGRRVREAMLATSLPADLQKEILEAYATLC